MTLLIVYLLLYHMGFLNVATGLSVLVFWILCIGVEQYQIDEIIKERLEKFKK
jgi:hypothetical protein